jgi:capsular polysaccharide biosynthesis protein
MDLTQLIAIVRRRWWLVVAVPLVVFAAGFWLTSDPPYESSLRATILIPGDTDIPGNAERPELMVLDDAPELVSSAVFAMMVVDAMPDDAAAALTVDDVKSALRGERYSRVLTVVATRSDADDAKAIADAAAQILPEAVNQYLVADGGEAATVQVIDPPSEPSPANTNRWLILAVETFVAFLVAVGLAVLLDGIVSRRSEPLIRPPAEVHDADSVPASPK